MPTKRMLIDSSHPEETRVVIINGNRLEDFDVEVESRKQLKGNIYLAKVTRVEPSLQAAFINYGGNRHGFLAFNEIHPDYYQIPIADREALLADEQARDFQDNNDEKPVEEQSVETLGGDISEEFETERYLPPRKHYKIQEVIKRNQVILVQVVKEERGTKGAALSTYLSLAGRYCVLMPNTARGGGISRKINNIPDRKRLKTIVGDLGIPASMAVIIRTAGSKRSKVEIKRDYEYTTRLWAGVRELTLESIAPCIVHEEGNLIKRSIRDLYSKEIEEVIIAGDTGYRIAKNFMKLLIPSHTKKVQPYADSSISLMQHFQIESQLDAIHSREVKLKSGGYIVIDPTEALVSIDVNSGKATKERNIEETAVKTNLEAAIEIAFQLKLRDLAGLIVIDFIDMENSRNQLKVERQIKDSMRNDRARIQIGRISPFGLLELSRQRLRPSLIETSSEACPHCNGSGTIRSIESTALHMLRVIEEECSQKNINVHTIFVPTSVAIYLFNHKREVLSEIENRYKTSIFLKNDDTLIPPDHRIESGVAGEISSINSGLSETKTSDEPTKKRRRRHNKRTNSLDVENKSAPPNKNHSSQKGKTPPIKEDQASNGNDLPIEVEEAPKRRRRGRRGGRSKIKSDKDTDNIIDLNTQDNSESELNTAKDGYVPVEIDQQTTAILSTPNKSTTPPPPKRRTRKKLPKENVTNAMEQVGNEKKVPDKIQSKAKIINTESEIPDTQTRKITETDRNKTTIINIEADESTTAPKRKGWWRR